MAGLILIVGCFGDRGDHLQRPPAYPSKQAEKNGDIVVAPSGLKNAEKMEEFLAKFINKKSAALRIAMYTVEGETAAWIKERISCRISLHAMRGGAQA
ncbi:hypothetical protein ABD76_06235 [Paenibacillus dendritiformis]|nr:hypothetical protein [Paenibacillus dendritiformis]